MKSILFIAFLALSIIGCDTPESTTGSDTSPGSMSSDSPSMTTPSTMGTDTVKSTPVDTTSTTPTTPVTPADTSTVR